MILDVETGCPCRGQAVNGALARLSQPGSGLLLPTSIIAVFSVEELEELKPRIGSRLVDGMTVNWPVVSAPNYRDQRRQN